MSKKAKCFVLSFLLLCCSPKTFASCRLSHQQISAISKYCSSGYLTINGYLRSGFQNCNNPKRQLEYKNIIQLISDAVQQNKLSNDIILYRGINNLNSLVNMINSKKISYNSLISSDIINTEIIENGFMSTSTSKEVALSWSEGQILFEIHSSKNDKKMDLQPFSKYPKEQEVLFDKGQKMIITDFNYGNGKDECKFLYKLKTIK